MLDSVDLKERLSKATELVARHLQASEELKFDLRAAKERLDRDHYGLLKLKPDARGPLLCLHRLQRIEKLCEELSCKPASIPLDKELMLKESLDRIKCVEYDLDKTKRSLHSAMMKQLEITESLAN